MSCSWCLLYILFITLCSHIVRTVPPDYCLSPLNRSDCKMAPKTVFSYYKPGSRCERETWRGCPTANKFDNEYLCSLNCIFKMRRNAPVDFDPCNIPLNQSTCGEEKFVITHEKGYCKEAWWGGCPTYNIFDDFHKCVVACNGIPLEEPIVKILTTPRTPPTETVPLERLTRIVKILEDPTTTEQETETESTTETDRDTESTTETDSDTESTTETDSDTESTTETDSDTESITSEETTSGEITTEEITTDDYFENVQTP